MSAKKEDEELLKLFSKSLKRNLERADSDKSEKEKTDPNKKQRALTPTPTSTFDSNTLTLSLPPSEAVPTGILEKLGSFFLLTKWGLPNESVFEFLKVYSNYIDVYQAFSYYYSLLFYKYESQGIEKTISENAKMFQELYDVYQKDIEYISNRFDVPALPTFKAILRVRGIEDETTPDNQYENLTNKRDRSQLEYSSKNDVLFGRIDLLKGVKREGGYEYEERVLSKLRSLGVQIVKEKNLASHQEKTTGDRVITPDILISNNQTVMVNGTEIRWIEVKSFFGSNFTLGDVNAQIKRYVNRWGNGVLIMKLGFSDSFSKQLPSQCICVEGKALNLGPIFISK